MPPVSKHAPAAPPSRDRGRNGLRRALTIGFLALCGLGPAALAVAPRDGEPVAVLRLAPAGAFPTADADAQILWMSASGRLAILHAPTPGFAAELYREGASLVVAAAALGGCLPVTSRTPSQTPSLTEEPRP